MAQSICSRIFFPHEQRKKTSMVANKSLFLVFIKWETSFFAFKVHFFKIPTLSKLQYSFTKLKNKELTRFKIKENLIKKIAIMGTWG
jgi:hypothetical protein